MKTLIFLAILFSAIALPALSELTDADLDKIRLIVNNSENSLKEHTRNEITTSENRMKDHVSDKIEGVRSSVEAFKWIVGILIAVIGILIAVIGIPLSLMARQNKKDTDQEKRIQELTEEIETLKQIVIPLTNTAKE